MFYQIAESVSSQILNNQVLSGGLTLGIIGAVIYQLKLLPKRVAEYLFRRMTIKITIYNNYENFKEFGSFTEFLSELSPILDGKNYELKNKNNCFGLVFGDSINLYRNFGLLFIVNKKEEPTENLDRKFKYEVIFFTSKKQKVLNFLEKVSKNSIEKYKKSGKIKIIENENTNTYYAPTLDEVIFDPEFIEEIIKDIDKFIKSEEFYKSIGVKYKRCYLFSGISGSGKSTLVAALARYFNKDLILLDTKLISEIKRSLRPQSLSDDIDNDMENRFILFEEVDRQLGEAFSENDFKRNGSKAVNGYDSLLNSLDGVSSPIGNILFMTTNDSSKIDQTFKRPGRIDREFIFTHASKYQMNMIFLKFFPGEIELAEKFSEFSGVKFSMAKLQEILLRSTSPHHAIELITEEK